MTFRLCIVAVALAAIGFGASRLNRRLRVDRPTPPTLAEKYGWERDAAQAEVVQDQTMIAAVRAALDGYDEALDTWDERLHDEAALLALTAVAKAVRP